MIEKLKKNWKPWNALNQEEKDTFELVNKKNCVIYRLISSDWVCCKGKGGTFNSSYVYRIKKDYEKPTTRSRPVYYDNDKLWFHFGGQRHALSSAVDLVDFLYYSYKEGQRTNRSRLINSSLTETPKAEWPRWVVLKG